MANCKTCGTGSRWWIEFNDGLRECPTCNGNPLLAGSGNRDWLLRDRQRAVELHGPRCVGDGLLLQSYGIELHRLLFPGGPGELIG